MWLPEKIVGRRRLVNRFFQCSVQPNFCLQAGRRRANLYLTEIIPDWLYKNVPVEFLVNMLFRKSRVSGASSALTARLKQQRHQAYERQRRQQHKRLGACSPIAETERV